MCCARASKNAISCGAIVLIANTITRSGNLFVGSLGKWPASNASSVIWCKRAGCNGCSLTNMRQISLCHISMSSNTARSLASHLNNQSGRYNKYCSYTSARAVASWRRCNPCSCSLPAFCQYRLTCSKASALISEPSWRILSIRHVSTSRRYGDCLGTLSCPSTVRAVFHIKRTGKG